MLLIFDTLVYVAFEANLKCIHPVIVHDMKMFDY